MFKKIILFKLIASIILLFSIPSSFGMEDKVTVILELDQTTKSLRPALEKAPNSATHRLTAQARQAVKDESPESQASNFVMGCVRSIGVASVVSFAADKVLGWEISSFFQCAIGVYGNVAYIWWTTPKPSPVTFQVNSLPKISIERAQSNNLVENDAT